MKNLANCKPSEFLRQTNLIRKAVERWLTVTDIIKLRKRLPAFEMIPPTASNEERHAINERNNKKREEQLHRNIMDILDSVLEEHPDETLEVLALCCFVPKEEVDDHPMSEYLESFSELITNKAVIDFFTLLAQLGSKNTQNTSATSA